jgi:RNA-directed DNA polymerase
LVSYSQDCRREADNRNNKERLTALLHHVDIDCLRSAFFSLKKQAAPGVDEVTWDQYAEQPEDNLVGLHALVNTKTYLILPSRRRCIPKADSRQRPLGEAGQYFDI